jgi:hypothetical protein
MMYDLNKIMEHLERNWFDAVWRRDFMFPGLPEALA